jgi:transposase
MHKPPPSVGIDVSKAALDVALTPDAKVRRYHNTPAGRRSLATALTKAAPARIVLEATGGYEHPLLRTLIQAGLPAVRVNPRQVRDFAKATGVLAKTDAIDARVLSRFASAVEPVHRPLPSPEQERLGRLQARREQIVGLRTAERNRLEQATDPLIKRTIQAVIRTLERQIEIIEAESAEVIAQHQKLERTYRVLTSVPGVGPVTAAVLMGQMPELGTLSRQAASALAGLAPYNDDSGQKKGARHIRGGRSQVRAALYMATLNAVKCNPVIQEDFARFIAQNRPWKVAMTACMRKLLTILNALVRDDMLWGEKTHHNPPENA